MLDHKYPSTLDLQVRGAKSFIQNIGVHTNGS
jgi:hypothetical protein